MKVPRDPVLHKLRHHRKAGPHSPPGRATRSAREAIAEGLGEVETGPISGDSRVIGESPKEKPRNGG